MAARDAEPTTGTRPKRRVPTSRSATSKKAAPTKKAAVKRVAAVKATKATKAATTPKTAAVLIREAAARLAAEAPRPAATTPRQVRSVRAPSTGEPIAPPVPPPPAPPVPTAPAAPQWTPPPPAPAAPPAPYFPTSSQPKKSRAVLVALVIGGLAIAGGGTGVLLATRDSKPSKAEYIASADKICAPANVPVGAVVKPTNYPELSGAAGTVASSTKAQVDKLRGLDRPGGADSAQIDTMVTSLDVAAQAAQRLGSAASGSSDAATASATKDMGTAFNGASTAATTYGFTACASGMKSGMDAVFGGSQAVIKTAFIAKADTACRAGARELDSISDPRSGSGAELARALTEVSAVFDRMKAEIRGLQVAPGDETTVADMLAAQDRVDAKGAELIAAAKVENGAAFVAAGREIDTLVTAADAKWDAYGLGSCGTNFGEI